LFGELCGSFGDLAVKKRMARMMVLAKESQKVCQLDGAPVGWLAVVGDFFVEDAVFAKNNGEGRFLAT
jgi:hypothetical protein